MPSEYRLWGFMVMGRFPEGELARLIELLEGVRGDRRRPKSDITVQMPRRRRGPKG